MKASSKSSAHTRFIPREEIDGCSAWRFSAMDGSEDAPAVVTETSEPVIDGPSAEALHEIRERAHAEGYALGHAAGGQEVRDALEATVRKTAEETAVRMAQLLHNTKEHLQKSEEQISRHILELACDLARQVVRQELQCNTQHLRPVITEALAQLVDDGLPATVRMNPGDLALMKGALQETLASGQVYENEFRIRRHDGVYRTFMVRAEPVHDEEGRILRWVGSNTDIEDLRRQSAELARFNETLEEQVAERTSALMQAEEALRQSQKMEAVGQLTGGIAHDFNNMLTGIITSLELIKKRIEQGRSDKVQAYADAALGSAMGAATLTHRLLAFARRQPLDAQPLDVAAVLGAAAQLVTHALRGEGFDARVGFRRPERWPAGVVGAHDGA